MDSEIKTACGWLDNALGLKNPIARPADGLCRLDATRSSARPVLNIMGQYRHALGLGTGGRTMNSRILIIVAVLVIVAVAGYFYMTPETEVTPAPTTTSQPATGTK